MTGQEQVCSLQCLQSSVSAVFSVCSLQCLQSSVSAVFGVCSLQCLQSSVSAVFSVCSLQCPDPHSLPSWCLADTTNGQCGAQVAVDNRRREGTEDNLFKGGSLALTSGRDCPHGVSQRCPQVIWQLSSWGISEMS